VGVKAIMQTSVQKDILHSSVTMLETLMVVTDMEGDYNCIKCLQLSAKNVCYGLNYLAVK